MSWMNHFGLQRTNMESGFLKKRDELEKTDKYCRRLAQELNKWRESYLALVKSEAMMSRNALLFAPSNSLRNLANIWLESSKEAGISADILMEDISSTCSQAIKKCMDEFSRAKWKDMMKQLENIRQSRLNKLKCITDHAEKEKLKKSIEINKQDTILLEKETRDEMDRFAAACMRLNEAAFEAFIDIQTMKRITEERCRHMDVDSIPNSDFDYLDYINSKFDSIRALSIVADD